MYVITISGSQINSLINHDVVMAMRLSCQLEANLYSASRETELLVKTEKRENTSEYFCSQSKSHK